MCSEARVGDAPTYLRTATAAGLVIASAVMFWVETQVANVVPSLLMTVGFTVAFFMARLLTIRLPQGDEVCIPAMVALVGLALVDVPMLIVASVVAGTMDAVARASRPCQLRSRLRDSVRGALILALLSPWQLVLYPMVSSSRRGDLVVVLALGAGISYAIVDVITNAVMQSSAGGVSVGRRVASLAQSLAIVYVVHVAMAAVVLRLQGVSGIWPFPVAILLTLILQNSFNLYIRIRRAYVETIRALAHAAELDRPHDSGHARRVADLSVAIGRRLGLSSHELERLGYAALLHDIGRMGAAGEDLKGDHARRGAEIAASIPFLEGVAPLILPNPQEEATSVRPPIGWYIVRTCSHYDRLRAELGAERALAELNGESHLLDRQVVDALSDIVRSKRIANGVSL